MTILLSSLYDVTLKRGLEDKAKNGFVRPTVSELFMTDHDYVETESQNDHVLVLIGYGSDSCTTPTNAYADESTDGLWAPNRAFNNLGGAHNSGNCFVLGLSATQKTGHWLAYDFGSGNSKRIEKYTIEAASDQFITAPKDFVFQGSNDNTSWTSIDTRTNQIFTASEKKTYTLDNVNSYRYYRILVNAVNNPTYWWEVVIAEVEMMEGNYVYLDSLSAPDAPNITGVVGREGSAIVSFTAPASDGGAPIQYYTATSTPGGVTATLNQSGSGNITVTGLTNDITYTFKVKATNIRGTGPESSASSSVTPHLMTKGDLFIRGTSPIEDETTNHGLTYNYSIVTNTAVKKYESSLTMSGGRLIFASSDYLNLPGDFTIDCWLNRTNSATHDTIFSINNYVGSNISYGLIALLYQTTNNLGLFSQNGVLYVGAPPITLGTWAHLAMVRYGTTFKVFVDGVQLYSGSNSWNILHGDNGITIGSYGNATTNPFNGYIERFRLVKGQALWTTGFNLTDAELFY